MKLLRNRRVHSVAAPTEVPVGAAPTSASVPGSALAAAVLDTVFPQHCVACGRAISGAVPLCYRCRASLRPIRGSRCRVCGVPLVSGHGLCLRCRSRELHYDCHRSVFAYSGVAKQVIIAYKFGGRTRLVGLLCNYLVPLIPPGAVVVPVPASRRGRRRRGYDQVSRLAADLERHHGVSVLPALTRTRGREQKQLDFDERSRNLAGAIRLTRHIGRPHGPGRMSVPGRRATVPNHVVLLDDVFTTGATVSECARVLRRAGADRIDAVTLAAD